MSAKQLLAYFLLIFVSLVYCTDSNEPLFLTSCLSSQTVEECQKAAQVPEMVPGIKSYSGYFTVDKKFESNLFFWYFPSDNLNDPLVVWLQGGPGSSSLFGLFYENGPISINNGQLEKRKQSWSRVSNLLFIDNPVGTGFSFTNSSEGYATGQNDIANNLYNMLVQFYTLFPNLKKNDLYIAGESYAGKYVPSFAFAIHSRNIFPKKRINLKGVLLGNALCDPVNMMQYSEYLYQTGIIGSIEKQMFKEKEDEIRANIKKYNWRNATQGFLDLILDGDNSMFKNITGFNMYYNYLKQNDDDSQDEINNFFKDETIRNNIHVGNKEYQDGQKVFQFLFEDIMKSQADNLKVLMNNYRVVIYNGQLDIIVAYPLTLSYLKELDWCGSKAYSSAPRKQWHVNGDVAGYSKTVNATKQCKGTFTEILVRNAGHMVPHDQPDWAFDLLSRTINKNNF